MVQSTTPIPKTRSSSSAVLTAAYLLPIISSSMLFPRLPNNASHQVILVSPSLRTMYRPACPRALISDDMFPQEKLFVSIPKAFERYPEGRFRFIHGTATELDHIGRAISINLAAGGTKKIEYHALVIATGASLVVPLLGLTRDDVFLRAKWSEFRKAAKNIVIAGGGPAGIETAGELGEFLNGRAGWFTSKLENPNVHITVVTAGTKIIPLLRPAIAKKAEEYLTKVGVTVLKNARIKIVEPHEAGTDNVASKATLTLEGGKTLDADLYIPAIGTRPNTGFIDQSLLTADGRVDTNSTLRVD